MDGENNGSNPIKMDDLGGFPLFLETPISAPVLQKRLFLYHEPPKPWENKAFGHLKTQLFTIKTSKNLGLGGSWYKKRQLGRGVVCWVKTWSFVA